MLVLKINRSKDDSYNLIYNIYKIIFPTAAIKKNTINILKYSFNSSKNSILETTRYVNNKNNYCTVSFYFNQNPFFELHIKPDNFINETFMLEIKNPIVLISDFTDLKQFQLFVSQPTAEIVLNCKSCVDEIFTVSGTLSNLQINHKLLTNFPIIKNWYEDTTAIINKILLFTNNFDLQQNTF